MGKQWRLFLGIFLVVTSIGFYYFYVNPYMNSEQPSYPSADTSPTSAPTAIPTIISLPETATIGDIFQYIVNNFKNSSLQDLLDLRYLGINNESDPIWLKDKGNYALTSQIGTTTATVMSANDYYTKLETDQLFAGKSNTDHNHYDVFYSETETDQLLADKSDTSHNHDSRYYTESQIDQTLNDYYTSTQTDSLLNDKSDTSHNHDSRYYTESEVDTALADKSDTSHNHDSSYYTKTQTDTAITNQHVLGSNASVLPIQRNPVRTDQMESGWADFYGNGTVSFDTSDYVSGAGSLKIVVSSNASNSGARKYVTPDEDWSGRFAKIYVKATDWTQLQEVKLLISTSGQFVSYYQVSLKPYLTDPTAHDNEWVEFVIPTSAFTTSGTPNWSTVNQLIVRGIGVNGQTPTIWFDEYDLFANPSSPMLSFTFDDGHNSDYLEAKPVLDTYGYKGTAFIIPDLLGTGAYLSQTQVDSLHQTGWEISGHGETNLTTLSATAAESELIAIKDYLLSHSYRGSDIYAYPNGGHDESDRALTQKYFALARSIANFNQPITYMSPMFLTSRLVHDYDAVATITGWIDAAVTNNEWLILTFHRITDATPASSTEYNTTDFQSIVDYANSAGIEVLPITQAILRMQSF